MMTLYLLFEAMESGRVTKQTQIPVSAHAASQPPTKMRFRRGETIDVDSAIRALVVKSANDVAVAVGEYLGGGSEDQFAAMMTAKARQLGMRSTIFRNASGLPDDGQMHDRARHGGARHGAARSASRSTSTISPKAISCSAASWCAATTTCSAGCAASTASRPATSAPRASTSSPPTMPTAASSIVVVMGADTARQRNDHVEALLERALAPGSGDLKLVFAE